VQIRTFPRQENERFRKQLQDISQIVSAYASKRVAREEETKGELKELKVAHQKRLLRTFEANSIERQYASFSVEQAILPGAEARIADGVSSEHRI